MFLPLDCRGDPHTGIMVTEEFEGRNSVSFERMVLIMWKALSSLFSAQPTQKKNKYLDAIEYGLRSVEESPFADLQASTQEISEIIKEKSLGIFGARLEVDPINKLILRIFIGPETGDYS